MKTIKQLIFLLMISLAFASCSKDFIETPLKKPSFDPGNRTITKIQDLKEAYAEIGEQDPVLIETPYMIKGLITANDSSGNIFKQLYVEDNTGAIQFGVDDNNLYTRYSIGQEVYVDLQGLYILKYGGEYQIGMDGAQANRIPIEIFKRQAHRNEFADRSKVIPSVFTIEDLMDGAANHDKDVNKLVRLENVQFVNGGDSLFISKSGASYTERSLKDASGKSLVIRTSSYAKDLAEKTLPKGIGSVSGILGRHRGNWQLIVRSHRSDIGKFDADGEFPEAQGVYYTETFGDPQKNGNFWPKIAEYKGFTNKDVTYSDATGTADVRALSGNAHIWFPKGSESTLAISGIKAVGAKKVVLSMDIAANLFDAGTSIDMNAISIKVNGDSYLLPSKILSNANGDNNKFYTVKVEIPTAEAYDIVIVSSGTKNTQGLRVGNLKVMESDGNSVIVPEPDPGNVDPNPNPDPDPQPTGGFSETFGTTAKITVAGKERWPLVSEYTGWDMKSPIKYTGSEKADVRLVTGATSHIWLAAKSDNFLQVEGVSSKKVQALKFDFAANLFDATATINMNVLQITVNGTPVTVPSKVLTNADHNKFETIEIANAIPVGENIVIKFFAEGTANTAGLRIDNIKIAEAGGSVTPDPDPDPDPQPQPGGSFLEGFGTPEQKTITTGTGTTMKVWPKLDEYTDFSMKSPVKYVDKTVIAPGGFGPIDIRSTKAFDGHLWLPGKKDATLAIEGISTKGKGKHTLSFDITANVFGATDQININVLKISVNGVAVTVPSKVLDKTGGFDNKYHHVDIANAVPDGDNITIEIVSDQSTNLLGFRLDNIKLTPSN